MRAFLMKHNAAFRSLALLCMILVVSGQGVAYSSKPGNIKGDTLVLDVGSLSFQGNHPVFPPYSSPDQCQKACKGLPGCNAWSFCASSTGCGSGSGCSSYVKAHPQLTTQPNTNPTIKNPAWKIPVTAFGPWGKTAGCQVKYGSDGSPQATEQWPNGMCSLKRVGNPGSPEWWSLDAKEGWISGTISTPASCTGVSPAACEGCLAVKDPKSCLACAVRPQVVPANLVAALDISPPVGSGCVKCYNSSTDPSKCSACLLKGGPCQPCPADTFPSGDVDQCIACANKYGAALYQNCRTCSTLATSNKVALCLGCLDKAKQLACPAGTTADSNGYSCVGLDQAAQDCSTCASSAADFGSCQTCVLTKPYSPGCGYCALLQTGSDQATCYRCKASSKVLNSACSDCVSYLTDPQQKASCTSCLADPNISGAGKSWCFGCQNWYSTPAGRQKCQKCLATNQTWTQTEYFNACSRLSV